jgi:uncharacterized protein YbjT (DUF2867 family)
MYTSAMHALVAGATGFIGGELVARLVADGADVRALVRDRERARGRLAEDPRLELFVGDVLDAASLDGAGDGIDIAYYLVHSMGRGSAGGDFEAREARSARAFARMCSAAGVARVVYLGGLGDVPGSKHLRARSPSTARR